MSIVIPTFYKRLRVFLIIPTFSTGVYNYPNILQKASAPVISNEECSKLYENTTRKVLDSNICVGNVSGSTGPCYGDKGGPIVKLRSDTSEFELVGIISWFYGCGRPFLPSVNTRVSAVLEYIEHVRNSSKSLTGSGFFNS